MDRLLTDKTIERYKNIAIVAWAIIGIFVILYGLTRIVDAISVVLRPVLFALIIVFLLKPILAYLERRGMNRTFALALTYVFFFILIAIIVLVLVPIITTEANQLVKAFPGYSENMGSALKGYQQQYQTFRLSSQANKIIESVLTGMQGSTIEALSGVPGFTISFLSLLLDFILAPLIAYFILMDRANLSKGLAKLVPEAIRPQSLYLAYRLNTAIEGVLVIMLMLAVLVGVLCSIGLFLMGIPYALILGLFAGFVQVIPYVGPVAGTVPAVIVAWVAKSGWFALAVAVYFTALTQVASLVITPIMMREQVGVHPLVVILTLLIGGALFGFWGVLLAVPAAAVIHELGSFMLLKPEERIALAESHGS